LGIAPDITRPLIASIAFVVGVGLLVMLIVWLDITKKRVMKRRDANVVAVFTVGAIAILIMCSIALLMIPQRTYDWDYSYGLEIKVLDSSPDISIGDLWVQTTRNHTKGSVYQYPGLNLTDIYGLDHTVIEDVRITCNGTPIFWGNHTRLFNVFSTFDRTIIFYQNGSQVIVYDRGIGFWDHPAVTYYFSGGGSWANIELRILGPAVDP